MVDEAKPYVPVLINRKASTYDEARVYELRTTEAPRT